jgi:hypothetical protein
VKETHEQKNEGKGLAKREPGSCSKRFGGVESEENRI